MKILLLAVWTIILFCSCEQKEVVPLPYKDQLAKDVAAIDSYLTANKISAEKDTSGFRYVISAKGNDFKPVLVDSIKVTYSLSLLEGRIILDKAFNTLLLNKLIKPWRYILPSIGEGGKLTLYIPSGLAYGTYPAGAVPLNSNLIFEIELVKVIKEFTGQLQKDVAIIDTYLSNNKITAIKDPTGLRYTITTPGASLAPIPKLTDSVVVNYTGKIMNDQTVFEKAVGKGFSLSASSTLRFWKIALIQFPQGTKATLYVPSGYAYGAYGTTGVPPYTNLTYEMELVKVIPK
jgi:FKBP-type peptidyl-prolyl cis-trans isomerase